MKRDINFFGKEHMRKAISSLGIILITVLGSSVPALAQHGAEAGGSTMAAIGAGIAIGLAALGGGLGQGKAASAALDSIGRNPSAAGKLFVPMILGLALVESLVILSFIIALQLVGKA